MSSAQAAFGSRQNGPGTDKKSSNEVADESFVKILTCLNLLKEIRLIFTSNFFKNLGVLRTVLVPSYEELFVSHPHLAKAPFGGANHHAFMAIILQLSPFPP